MQQMLRMLGYYMTKHTCAIHLSKNYLKTHFSEVITANRKKCFLAFNSKYATKSFFVGLLWRYYLSKGTYSLKHLTVLP